MTGAEMSAEFDDHGFDDATDERKSAVLNDAYQDVCSRAPWPFLEKTVTLTFDGSSSVPVNLQNVATLTDFRAATAFSVSGTTAGTVKFMRRDDWLRQYGQSPSTGTPSVFFFKAGQINFYPTPAASTTIVMDYICYPAAIDVDSAETDILLPPAFHRALLVNGALFKLYAMEDDTDIAPTFETFFERGLQNALEALNVRQYQDNDYVHPVAADDLNQDYSGWFGI